jgi:hypothetical protein
MARVSYKVPGLIVPVRQPSSMACWAAMFTMMYSWRNRVSIPIRDAVAQLGQTYLDCFDNNTGLPIEENRNLAAAAGMSAEPLENPSVEGWLRMLQDYGLLWTSYGWQVFDKGTHAETRAGRHIIILYGMWGDVTSSATVVKYVDPGDGAFHEMSFDRLVLQHETGFAMRPLDDSQLTRFSQIMHY